MDLNFIRLKGHLAPLGEDPATLDTGGTWRAALTVREDQDTVPSASILWVVGHDGGSIEVGATTTYPLRRYIATLAPRVEVFLESHGVEGHHVNRHFLRERSQLGEELHEHLVAHRSGLIDGHEQLRLVASLHTRMDVGVTLVDPLDGGGSAGPDEGPDEVTKHAAPVDDVAHRLSDLCNEIGRDVTPTVGLTVGVLHSLLHDRLDLALYVLSDVFRDTVPDIVIVERTEVAHSVGVSLHLFLDLLEVPLRGLHGRQ